MDLQPASILLLSKVEKNSDLMRGTRNRALNNVSAARHISRVLLLAD
jgi:hypothetical protein